MKHFSIKQKCIVSLILVIVMGFILVYTYTDEPENEYSGVIRLHVIANSDSSEDQNLKLKVRDEIIKEVGNLENSENIEESRSYLKRHLKDMEAAAAKVIKENGKEYDAKADIGVRWIPAKTYGDMYFPAGNYEALNVTLGKGEGHNWWCVLFPPLCLIEEDESAMEELGVDKEKQLQVKSKLMELLKSKGSEE
ncbi:MAG: stage II sporulation protein R [Firmicutes bacterium]|nr:stage II sporulation protein R [Bacillota bacterium]